jgi:hypothetical protein
MSEPISVECPKCHAKLKLKSAASIGKKIGCPKCKKPFVVPAAPTEDDEFGFMSVSEPEPDPEDEFSAPEQEDEFEAPVVSSRTRGKKGKAKKSQPVNWQKPAAILAGIALLIGLFVGAGYLVSNLDLAFLAGNKIDMTYLPPESDFIVHAKVADAWGSPFVQSIVNMPMVKNGVDQARSETGVEPTDVASITFGVSGFADQMKAAADLRKQLAERKPGDAFPTPAQASPGQSVTVIRLKTALDQEKFRTQANRTEAVEHSGATYYRAPGGSNGAFQQVAYFPKADVVVLAPENDMKGVIERGTKTTRRADLDFIDSSKQVLIAIVPKDSSVFDQPATPIGGMPTMPESLNTLNDAMRGKLKGFCLGLSAGEALDVTAMTNCTTPEASKELAAEIDKAIGEAKTKFSEQKAAMPPQFAEFVNLADSILNSVKTESSGSGMLVSASVPGSATATLGKLPGMMMMGMLGGAGGGMNPLSMPGGPVPGNLPTLDSVGGAGGENPFAGLDSAAGAGEQNPLLNAREAALRAQSRNNLKQIGLALHNHHDAHRSLPANAIYDNGRPLLSWRVQILPYIDQTTLYNRFNLKEPWDSPQNKALLTQMPPQYRSPASKASIGMTNYLGVTGADGTFEGTKGLHFRDFQDGTSNTIAVVEVADSHAVPWTKPADYEFDSASPPTGLTGLYTGGFNALLCDGAVRFVGEATSPSTLKLLFTRNDGQPVPDF